MAAFNTEVLPLFSPFSADNKIVHSMQHDWINYCIYSCQNQKLIVLYWFEKNVITILWWCWGSNTSCCVLTVGHFGQDSEGISSKWLYWLELWIVWHYDWFMLAGGKKLQRRDSCGCRLCLPWFWTEEAAPWTSQQLRFLVFHIADVMLSIALCWCWQCLLTVGGNLLHTL
jgi:hypothetical protein